MGSFFNTLTLTTMSNDQAVEKVVKLQKILYTRTSMLARIEKEQTARLHYIASRIRAAIREWVSVPEDFAKHLTDEELDGRDLWWWTGLQKELVKYNYS